MTHDTMAQQAARIIDERGETEMWQFISLNRKPMPPLPPGYGTFSALVIFQDESALRHTQGRYHFGWTDPDVKEETRDASFHPGNTPVPQELPVPIAFWPNSTTLHDYVMDLVTQNAADRLGVEHLSTDDPALREHESHPLAPDLRTAVREWISTDSISDDLAARIDQELREVAERILDELPTEQSQRLEAAAEAKLGQAQPAGRVS